MNIDQGGLHMTQNLGCDAVQDEFHTPMREKYLRRPIPMFWYCEVEEVKSGTLFAELELAFGEHKSNWSIVIIFTWNVNSTIWNTDETTNWVA